MQLIFLTFTLTTVVFSSAFSAESSGLQAFKKNLYPILKNQCQRCHSNDGPGPNHSSSDEKVSYKKILKYITFSDIKNSKLILKGLNSHTDGYSKPGDPKITVTEEQLINAIQAWWDGGENKTFLENKKVLKSQIIPNLADNGEFMTMSWDLGEIDRGLSGTQFSIDIQKFVDRSEAFSSAYRIKNPRLQTNNLTLKIRGIYLVVNDIGDSKANNYEHIHEVVQSEVSLSPFKQIFISGSNQDKLGFAFDKLEITNAPITLNNVNSLAIKAIKIEKPNLDIFDEKITGKAAHFVKINAPVEFDLENPDNTTSKHSVRLTKSFEMQATAVTQLQWYMIAEEVPSYFKAKDNCDKGNFLEIDLGDRRPTLCKNHPVENVSWEDAQKFINILNKKQNKYSYRLPTEAEWEFVARSGLPSGYLYGWGSDFDGNYAWYAGNSQNRTHEVAIKQGLSTPDGSDLIYDMSGNVWQMVQDWYDNNYGLSAKEIKEGVIDPQGPQSGSGRVIRGGGWVNDASVLRSGYRGYWGPSDRYGNMGFRLVRTAR